MNEADTEKKRDAIGRERKCGCGRAEKERDEAVQKRGTDAAGAGTEGEEHRMKWERYEKIRSWLEEGPGRLACLRLLYRVLPQVTAAGYAVCLAFSAAAGRKLLLRNLFVPAAVFALVTIFRSAVDLPRPYEVWELPPLVPKDKKGRSFPSRHAASAGVIAMAWWQVSVPAGALFLLAAAGIAASRVLAGVHFVRDVAAGLALGVGAGALAILIG